MVVNGSTLAVEQVNHYYPYGGLFAESTGGEKQPFKYNGKELDRMYGLNWYDHGARHNDAAIGRWHSVDPLAHKYYSISPYVYCADNPVNYGDYNGMSYEVDSTGNVSYKDDKYKKTRIVSLKDGKTTEVNEGQSDVLDGLINSQEKHETDSKGNEVAYTQTARAGRRSMLSLFRFLAKHTVVEWGLTSFFSKGGAPASYSLATSHQRSTCVVPYEKQWNRVRFSIHSHPRPGGQPSVYDIDIAHRMSRATQYQPLFGIYEVSVDKYLPFIDTNAPQDYDENSPRDYVPTLEDLIDIFNPLFK